MSKLVGYIVLVVVFLNSVWAQDITPIYKPLEVVILSHQDEKNVAQKSKLELGINVSTELHEKMQNFFNGRSVHQSQRLNPFLSWELDVEATFIHHESGQIIKRPGFFYRKMERDPSNDYWRDVRDNYLLRVRFLPESIGNWEVHVTIKEHGKITYSTLTGIVFNVAASAYPGYVKVNEQKRYFERDGEIIIPTGINQPSPYTGNNMIHNWDNEAKLSMESWCLFLNDVETYALQGGKYFRFFMMPSCSDIEFEELGNYYDRMNFAWEIDNMLEICERENMVVNFNMLYHTPFMRMADYHQFRWDYTSNWHDPEAWPYRDRNPVYAYSEFLNSRTPSDMFLNKEAMEYVKQRIRYIIARWGYSTAIGSFELMSEPWHMNEDWFHKETPYDSVGNMGDNARQAAFVYHREIANYIKKDLQHKSHPLGAVGKLRRNANEAFSHPSNPDFKYNDSTWFDKNIDFISISYYSGHPAKMIIAKRGRSNNDCEQGENSIFCAVETLFQIYNKPILFGEADHGDDTHYCAELEGHFIDIMRYNLNGIAGHYLWRVFAYPHPSNSAIFDERTTWPSVIVAQDFFNAKVAREILANFSTQGREKSNTRGSATDTKEHQYILSANGDYAMGYVYNRTYNVHTAALDRSAIAGTSCIIDNPDLNSPQEIAWKPKRMNIEGLERRADYVVKFYGYKSGTFIGTVEGKSSFFGKLNVEHPTLGKDRFSHPVIWYVIEKK